MFLGMFGILFFLIICSVGALSDVSCSWDGRVV